MPSCVGEEPQVNKNTHRRLNDGGSSWIGTVSPRRKTSHVLASEGADGRTGRPLDLQIVPKDQPLLAQWLKAGNRIAGLHIAPCGADYK